MQLLGSGWQRSSKVSRVSVTGQILAFASWKVTLSGDDLGTVNFTSFDAAVGQTFDEGILGKINGDISFGGDWDASIDIFLAPGIYPRDDLAVILLYPSQVDNDPWAFPYMRVRNAENGGEVSGKVTMTCSGKNQGPFTGPGAATFPEPLLFE